MQTISTTSKPWYREPWPWILMAGPAIAVLGCIVTIYLAFTRFSDEPIIEGAVQRGLVVQRTPAADPAASAAAPKSH